MSNLNVGLNNNSNNINPILKFNSEEAKVKPYKKKILDTLQSGGTIYFAADIAEGQSSEEITCLGVKMKFPTGMIYFAHQTEATIIPFFHFYIMNRAESASRIIEDAGLI